MGSFPLSDSLHEPGWSLGRLPKESEQRSPGTLSNHHTHGSLGFLSLTLPSWVTEVTVLSLPSHGFAPPSIRPLSVEVICLFLLPTPLCFLSVMRKLFFMRFRSAKSDEAKEGRWGSGGTRRAPHSFQIFPHELIPSQIFHLVLRHLNWPAKACASCFLLALIKHKHLLMTNKNQRCDYFALETSSNRTDALEQLHSSFSWWSDRDVASLWQHLIHWCWLSVIP